MADSFSTLAAELRRLQPQAGEDTRPAPRAIVYPTAEQLTAGARRIAEAGCIPRNDLAYQYLSAWVGCQSKTHGLLLCGAPGTGKTTFAERVVRWKLRTANYLVGLVRKHDRLSPAYWHEAYDQWDGDQQMDLAIDDLGREPLSVAFGQREELLDAIIDERYRAWLQDPGQRGKPWRTLVTSNLRPEQLQERYGERLVDRLREMCIYVELDGLSWR